MVSSNYISRWAANRLRAYAGQNVIQLDDVVSEIASGLNDRRPKLRKLLGYPSVHTVIVEHRERLARLGVGDVSVAARGQPEFFRIAVPPGPAQ